MDFTIPDMPQQQGNITASSIAHSHQSPTMWQSQQLLQKNVDRQFFLVSYRQACFSLYYVQPKPISNLVCCIESTSINVSVENIHIKFQCARAMLFTLDGSVHAPQDPESFYYWKQSSKGYF